MTLLERLCSHAHLTADVNGRNIGFLKMLDTSLRATDQVTIFYDRSCQRSAISDQEIGAES